jgi:hypothetical protein
LVKRPISEPKKEQNWAACVNAAKDVYSEINVEIQWMYFQLLTNRGGESTRRTGTRIGSMEIGKLVKE